MCLLINSGCLLLTRKSPLERARLPSVGQGAGVCTPLKRGGDEGERVLYFHVPEAVDFYWIPIFTGITNRYQLKLILLIKRRSMRKFVILMSCLFLFLSMVSCATVKREIGPSSDLKETVITYYELKKQGRFSESWHFERMSTDKDETRRENSRRLYLGREGGIPLKDYQILRIGEEGSGPQGFTPVRIKLITDWPPLPFPTPEGDRVLEMDDLWEKIDGKWYHVKAGLTKFW